MAKMEMNILNLNLVKNLISAIREHRDDLPIELQKSLDDIVEANEIEKFKNLTAEKFMNMVRES